jgi:hypothetical protein
VWTVPEPTSIPPEGTLIGMDSVTASEFLPEGVPLGWTMSVTANFFPKGVPTGVDTVGPSDRDRWDALLLNQVAEGLDGAGYNAFEFA